MPLRPLLCLALATVASLCWCSSARAQEEPAGQPPQTQAPPAATPDPSEKPPELQPHEVDQTVVNVPTTLPLKRHHSYFRLTHRFVRDLTNGGFSDLAQSLFSLDDGAIIGLEYRFGITDTIQAGVHRSILGKTIEAFGKWDAWQESAGHPIGLSF